MKEPTDQIYFSDLFGVCFIALGSLGLFPAMFAANGQNYFPGSIQMLTLGVLCLGLGTIRKIHDWQVYFVRRSFDDLPDESQQPAITGSLLGGQLPVARPPEAKPPKPRA